MPEPEPMINDGTADTPESRAELSAREVTVWETARSVANSGPMRLAAADRAADAVDADRANAGAIVSRAHRADKAAAHATGPKAPTRPADIRRPSDWDVDAAPE